MSGPLISNAATVRVTRVDGCGRPVCGPENSYITDCFASVEYKANVDDGTDIKFTAANGRTCGFKRGCPTFNGFDVTYTFFQASPELVEIMTGSPVVFGYDGRPIGFDSCSIPCRAGFALEVWADVLGPDVCPEEATGDGAWIYVLSPWLTNGQIGDLTLADGAVNLTLDAATRAGGKWAEGPYDVLAQDAAGTAGPMLAPLGPDCHRRILITTVEPPEPSTDYVPVLCDASS